MDIKTFKDLTQIQIDELVDFHFNYWVKFNPLMKKENTEYKFKHLYCEKNLPFGLALFDENKMIGYCVLKIENLKKYPDIFPWISDVMIFPQFQRKGYGRALIDFAIMYLKKLGYKKVYVWTDQAPTFYTKIGFTFLKMVEKNEGGFGKLYTKDI